jgi:hypothetical protein
MIIASEEEMTLDKNIFFRMQTANLEKPLYCITENVPNTHAYTKLLQITQKGILISPKQMLQAVFKFQ